MLDSMTPEQFDEWLAMYVIEPWGIELTAGEEPKESKGLASIRGVIGV